MVLKLSKICLALSLCLLTQCLLSAKLAFGFSLISASEKARLDATEDRAEITFYVTPSPPPITEKRDFRDGRYVHLSNEDFWLQLINEAMAVWNRVPGAYIQISAEVSSSARQNPEDRIHTISLADTNFTASAFARPLYEDGIIYDCDIAIGTSEISARNLAYILLHELGHCLGLGHNHTDYGAIMGYARTDRNLTLSIDDMAGLAYLYPQRLIGDSDEWIGCGRIGAELPLSSRAAAILCLIIPVISVLVRRNRYIF